MPLRMFWSCLVHASILLCSINSLVTTSFTNESDRTALLAFKGKITGDPHGALSLWNDSNHYCEWHGVTCSRRHHNRVTVLHLDSKELEGTLSPHIGNLSFLKTLVLTENNFHGEIPEELGRLFRLSALSLNNNSFVGEIPTNLSHCSNITEINLIDNQLSGTIPVELTFLPKLSYLGLAKNKLQGIPPSLGNLSSLTILSLGDNNLGSIPQDLCRIRQLEFLQLALSNLTGIIPTCLYNLSHLTLFSVAQNQLYGSLPQGIGLTLPNLQQLFMGGNNFSGTIPTSLSNASRLNRIALNNNQFVGQVPLDFGRLQGLQALYLHSNQLGTSSGDDLKFINSLTNCSTFEYLSIEDNSLKSPMPNSIANLTKTTHLSFGKNQIYGSILSGIGNLVNLRHLDFELNNLTGNIPTDIGMLTQIQRMYFTGNRLSGQIPNSFSNLTQLTVLTLSQNKLHGRTPSSLGNCQSLSGLYLSSNRLNGTIPKQVIGLSSLKLGLDLSNNDFSGSLPWEVGNLSDLVVLDLSRNRLSGHIPDTLGNCLTLEILMMESNFFEGNIPRSLNTLKGVKQLDLSRNKLSGPIPEYLENFTLLTSLNLSYNELEGPVPKYGVFANASQVSLVGNSKLCGGVVELKLLPCRIKKKEKSLTHKVLIRVIVASLSLVLLLCFFIVLYRRRMPKKKPSSPSLNHQYPRISYAELVKATNNFSVDNLLGVGSYGSVYKGILDQGTTVVAVKVFNLQQRGASKSFLSECNALRNLRHRNLIKIVTCCSSLDFQGNDFKALVFEFMPNGSLEEWLHSNQDGQHELENLSFLQRLNIAIDVASALDYLHHHSEPAIVHCDLKPSNVLLDDDMTAHVADFGLAKIFSITSYNSSQSQASSIAIKGSTGYVAPEYGMGGEVSKQGDVYSYGILLLEMFTGKRPTDNMFQDGRNLHSFAKMALPERVKNIVDPKMLLEGSNEAIKNSDRQVRMNECLVSAMRLGVTCSAESPIERVDMGEVITKLYHMKDHYQGVRTYLE